MKTLKELIVAAKCRKGKAVGITKKGAFWLVCEPVFIRSFGGDGVGQNGSDCRNYLQLRHFRSGDVAAVVKFSSWHQNSGTENTFQREDSILECIDVEAVIAALKGISENDYFGGRCSAYGDNFEQNLTDELTRLGMNESEKSPDEE